MPSSRRRTSTRRAWSGAGRSCAASEIPSRVTGAGYIGAVLSDRDTAILEFEESWWLFPGPKDRSIREYLGMSATRYYQALRRLMDDADACEAHPMVIYRLRRVRDGRLARASQRLGDG
ncbi:MAG: DUF3263 domain-containing protein [Acidimicrobiia bacterium]|nr:DUF3263 domain-containing protein [Acidimicrobiia bacterium]NNC75245.1 DUF3263 domain-containing protein [Acidimicrobiia bacterium]